MKLLDNFNVKSVQIGPVCYKWDSRDCPDINNIESLSTETISSLIQKYNKYVKFSKCFITSKYLNQINQYLDSNKHYYKCEFEFFFNQSMLFFLKHNTFKQCTFYISNYKDFIAILQKTDNNILNSIKANNFIIKNSYIEYLSPKYNFDLGKIPNKLINGISINNSDLSKCTLPKDHLFFQKLDTNTLYNIIFGNVDFKFYDIHGISFSCIDFGESILSTDTTLNSTFIDCILPPIDFNLYDKNPNFTFIGCTFNNNTIFPKNKNFFLDCSIYKCNLPNYDYSEYLVKESTFKHCKFDNEATLPKDVFNSKNIQIINHIDKLPIKHLEDCVKFAHIDNPNLFIDTYSEYLPLHLLALLHIKYNLNNIKVIKRN